MEAVEERRDGLGELDAVTTALPDDGQHATGEGNGDAAPADVQVAIDVPGDGVAKGRCPPTRGDRARLQDRRDVVGVFPIEFRSPKISSVIGIPG